MLAEGSYYRDPSSLYSLQSHPSYWFYVGRTETKQVISGLLGAMFCSIVFDDKGELTEVQERPLAVPLASPELGELGVLQDLVASEVERVRNEQGLTDETIHIRRFRLPKLQAGIDDLPDDLQEYITSRDISSPKDEDLEEAIEGWKEEESLFVFWWGSEDFYVDGDGMVTSS